MTLRYQSTAGELARAHVDYSPAEKVSARSTRLLGLACLVPALVYLVSNPTAANAPVAIGPLAIGVLLLGLSTPYSMRRRLACARVTGATSDQWFAWSHYEAVKEDANCVVLILRGGAGVRWIPARAFAGRDQQAAWSDRVAAWRAGPPKPDGAKGD